MDAVAEQAVKDVVAMRGIVESYKQRVDSLEVSNQEIKEQVERQAKDYLAKIEELNRNSLPAVNPLTRLEEACAMQRGNLFGGRMKLPFARAMAMPAYHPALRDSDKEQLQALQDAKDGTVIRYWHTRIKNPTMDKREILGVLVGSPEFRDFYVAMARSGYLTSEEIGKFAEIVTSPTATPETRAGIIHPGAGGVGAGLTFTFLTAQLFDKIRLEGGIQNEFVEVPLPRANTDFPALLSDTMGILGGPSGAPYPKTDLVSLSESTIVMPLVEHITNPTFGAVQFRCVHLLAFMLWNDDMAEDSIIPWLPLMRQMISRALARAENTAIINGVRSGTAHLDSDVTVSYDARKAWHGLRKLGHTTKITGGGGALTTTLLRKNRANLGIWGRNPLDLFHLIHVAGWYDILSSATDLLTVDKFGDQATVKTGTIAKLDAVDLKMNEALRTDLNASGVFDNTTTTRTITICVRRDRFMRGTFGQPEVEETRIAPALATLLQVDVREDFKPMEQTTAATNTEFAAGTTPLSVMYNVLTTS